MDPLPPNNNRINNNRQAPVGKDDPNREGEQRGAREMDVFGNDMRDVGPVIAIVFFGLIRWLLREMCSC